MSKELVERVKWLDEMIGTYDLEYVLNEAHAVVADVLAALSPVEDAEVQRVTKGIRESFCYENHGCGPMPYCLCSIAEEGADLIERLAREKRELRNKNLAWLDAWTDEVERAETAERQRDEALTALKECPSKVEQDEGDEWGFSVDPDDLRDYCKKSVARIRAMNGDTNDKGGEG